MFFSQGVGKAGKYGFGFACKYCRWPDDSLRTGRQIFKTKTGVRQSTKQGYVTVQRLLAKEAFGKKTIRSVKTSDAKLFLIKLQQED